MIIQVWHARNSNYVDELYEPLKHASFFVEHTFLFPHDGSALYNSRETLKTVDLFIVEVSCPATWLGIEIGFASLYRKKILCIYKKWSHISSSLKDLTEDFIEYDDTKDMIDKVWSFLKNI